MFCFLSSDQQVKLAEQGMGYLAFGGLVTSALAVLPLAFRVAQRLDMSNLGCLSLAELVELAVRPATFQAYTFFFITTVQRVCLTGLFFFMMCVAERTYKQVSGDLEPFHLRFHLALVDKTGIVLYVADEVCGFFLSSTETPFRQVLQPPHFSSQSKEIGDSSF